MVIVELFLPLVLGFVNVNTCQSHHKYEFNCTEDLRQAQANLGVFPGATGNMYIANFFYPFLSCLKFTELEVVTLLKTA